MTNLWISTVAAAPDALPPLWRLITKFTFFGGLAVAMGSSVAYVAAVRPALRRSSASPADRDAVRRRSSIVLAIAGVILVLSLYPQLAGKVARAATGDFGASLAPTVIGKYLALPGVAGQWVAPGTFTAIQFIGGGICGILLILLFIPQLRFLTDVFAWIAAVGIIGTQLVTVLPTDFSKQDASGWASTILTDLHPVSGCVWVGGVLTLATLVGVRKHLSQNGSLIWAIIWKRFSLVAEVCVGVTIITGIFVTWENIGSVEQLWQTEFGRALSLKILLVAGLIAVGAYNEFVLLPRVARLRASGETGSLFRVVLHHFPRSVAVEVVLGIVVLGVIPFLNDSARAQAGAPDDAGDPGGIFVGVLAVLVFGVIAFVASLRMHAAVDRKAPRSVETAEA